MRLKIFICLLLAGITLALYWPAADFTFIYRDDPDFLLAPQLAAGLPMSFNWAMTGVVAANWHPLTTFSFLLMHEIFGLDAGAEHLVNVIFHAANAVLLFLVLLEMTKAAWRSALVAAIFAWHPLHVESVAWIAERKDVLFTFFMLLSLWCYALYAQQQPAPAPGKGSSPGFLSRNAYYNLAFVFFILSFLSKAMVVTLPFLLLLLDYWPLQRLNRATLRSLLFEKWRFFGLAIIFCVLTFRFQKSGGALVSLGHISMTARLENAVLSYVNYLGQFFWPVNLAVLYPFPLNFDHVQVLLDALLLLAISAFCLLQISRRPYLAVGWFWYLGTLVPVIGLVQIGAQGMADRYAYITLIGPSISLVWLVWEAVRTSSFWKYLSVSAATVMVALCAILTEKQLQLWKDTVTLFSHTLALVPDNGLADGVLALGLEHEGHWSQAAVQYRMSIASHPASNHFMANFRFAELMVKMGYYGEAEARLEAALQIAPQSTDVLNNLAWVLATSTDAKARNGTRAVQMAEQACDLTHYHNPFFMTTLAAAYAEAGRFDDAIAMTQKTITLADQYGLDSLSGANQEFLQIYTGHQTYAQTHSGPQNIVHNAP
jgi:tetratricopeptide (TPR) repeat protein